MWSQPLPRLQMKNCTAIRHQHEKVGWENGGLVRSGEVSKGAVSLPIDQRQLPKGTKLLLHQLVASVLIVRHVFLMGDMDSFSTPTNQSSH